MGRTRVLFACALLGAVGAATNVRVNSLQSSVASIVVRVGASLGAEPIDGRLLLLISKDSSTEPRFQVDGTSLNSAQVFGIDVEGLKAGEERTFDGRVLGYPLESLRELPSGEYTVQALLHKYETFRLATGHTVKLPMDRGEGQQWNLAPGNLYSAPQTVRWDGGRGAPIRIAGTNGGVRIAGR